MSETTITIPEKPEDPLKYPEWYAKVAGRIEAAIGWRIHLVSPLASEAIPELAKKIEDDYATLQMKEDTPRWLRWWAIRTGWNERLKTLLLHAAGRLEYLERNVGQEHDGLCDRCGALIEAESPDKRVQERVESLNETISQTLQGSPSNISLRLSRLEAKVFEIVKEERR